MKCVRCDEEFIAKGVHVPQGTDLEHLATQHRMDLCVENLRKKVSELGKEAEALHLETSRLGRDLSDTKTKVARVEKGAERRGVEKGLREAAKWCCLHGYDTKIPQVEEIRQKILEAADDVGASPKKDSQHPECTLCPTEGPPTYFRWGQLHHGDWQGFSTCPVRKK